MGDVGPVLLVIGMAFGVFILSRYRGDDERGR